MELIERRRAEGTGGDDILAQLLAAGLDDAELRDHLVTLLAAGHETTAGSLAWALERLARAPDVFARVRAGDEAWIDAVVKETLRIRPVLTVAPRKLAAPLRVDGLGCRPGCTWHRASTSSIAARTSPRHAPLATAALA
jgi:cytochrome P450